MNSVYQINFEEWGRRAPQVEVCQEITANVIAASRDEAINKLAQAFGYKPAKYQTMFELPTRYMNVVHAMEITGGVEDE